MYTGTSKKAIVIKNTENSIFEAAYFILKDNAKDIKESEMVREANKILKNNLIGGYFFPEDNKAEKKKKKSGVFSFWTGVLVSLLICTVVFLFIR